MLSAKVQAISNGLASSARLCGETDRSEQSLSARDPRLPDVGVLSSITIGPWGGAEERCCHGLV